MSYDEAELRELEESLWRAGTRFDREYMDAVLTADFIEFGRSGRRYSREEILSSTGTTIEVELPLPNFAVTPLTADVVLVTYLSRAQYETLEVSNRASVWVRRDGRWQLAFHQGTPTVG